MSTEVFWGAYKTNEPGPGVVTVRAGDGVLSSRGEVDGRWNRKMEDDWELGGDARCFMGEGASGDDGSRSRNRSGDRDHGRVGEPRR